MVRIVIAAILCLFATACGSGEPVFPSGGCDRPDAGEFVSLGLAGLLAALATYALSRRAGPSLGAERTLGRALRAVLVYCVAFLGVLVTENRFVGTFGPTTRGLYSSVVAIAWGTLLLLHFRALRRTSRLGVLARVGPPLVLAPIPFFLFAIWIDGVPLIWKIAYAFAIIATMCAHMTFVAEIPLRLGQRWLVVGTRAGSACSAGVVSLGNLGVLRGTLGGDCLMLVLPLTIAGTILVILCRRRVRRTDATVASAPDRPPT